MLFNSFAFALFLPIVFALYWALPHKYRWILILLASYYFYMSWNAKYVFLILFTTIISYGAARLLEQEEMQKRKKWILVGTAVLCLGVLFFFKYFNFVSGSVADFLALFAIKMNPITLNLLLPVGISFYTFQTLSYVIDVYRGDVAAERHFGYYAAFISFFPQLVAGPIERTSNLLPQIKKHHTFDYNQATYGLKLIAWGYFKKIVIADTLSPYVSWVYDAPQNFSGFALVLATLFFTLQIYCDFSGYSDIAIGTSKLLGINLMTNFKSPYFSQSIKEFWSRWHISLSTWFRDYVYIPLGGNRVSKIRYHLNLMIVFLVSGLWHGANWTFVLWGGIHGAGQVVESILVPKQTIKRRSKGIFWLVRVAFVFAFASFAWIFFVSHSVQDAFYVISHLFTGISAPLAYVKDGLAAIEMEKFILLKEACLIFMMAAYDYFSLQVDVIQEISKKNVVIRWLVYLCLGWIIVFFSQKGVAAEFVYFQF
ncbi:MAG: MBOAT family protein [Oscillospiraceae bacterium]|nr:MBOAT family protein [Oscillospiraceae bacterium]